MPRNPTFEVTIDFPDLIFDEDIERWEAQTVPAVPDYSGMYQLGPPATFEPLPRPTFEPWSGLAPPVYNGNVFQVGGVDPGQPLPPPEPEYSKGYVLTAEQARKINELKEKVVYADTYDKAAQAAVDIQNEIAAVAAKYMMKKNELMARLIKMQEKQGLDSKSWTGLADSA